jgi:hypothetical protein
VHSRRAGRTALAYPRAAHNDRSVAVLDHNAVGVTGDEPIHAASVICAYLPFDRVLHCYAKTSPARSMSQP